jgi:hypothetical protein
MKVSSLILGLIVLLTVSTLGVARDDADLVAYYPLDGNPKDASGNTNDGKVEGGSKWDKGKFGKAVHLDPGAYVEIKASKSLHGDIFKKDPFTISAWIQPTFKGSTWEHIWRSLPGGAGHNTFFVNKDSGLLSWRGRVGGAWTVLCQTEGGVVKVDKWAHTLVLGDGKKFKIYVNGKKAVESDFKETGGANETFRLGGTGGETFAGAIDDVGVFSRALDEKEIILLQDGVEAFLAVEPQGKLTTTWGTLKRP